MFADAGRSRSCGSVASPTACCRRRPSDPDGYVPLSSAITDAGLARFLATTRRMWANGVANVPTVMDGDLDATMPEILGSSPVLLALRARSLTTIDLCYEPTPFVLDAEDNCSTQSGLDAIAHEFLGFETTDDQSNGLLGSATRVLALPLVTDADGGDRRATTSSHAIPPRPPPRRACSRPCSASRRRSRPMDQVHVGTRVASRSGRSSSSSRPRPRSSGCAGPRGRRRTHAISAPTTARRRRGGDDDRRGFGTFDRGTLAAAYPIDAVRPPSVITAATPGQPSLLSRRL